jgi:MoxR-like ATPase
LKLEIGYPELDEEERILDRFNLHDPLGELEPVVTPEQVVVMQHLVPRVTVSDPVRRYIVQIVRATRAHDAVELGASPRGSLALYRSAQALAALRGREFVLPDDVKELAVDVLGHRLMLQAETRLRGRTPATIIRQVLDAVPVPVE